MEDDWNKSFSFDHHTFLLEEKYISPYYINQFAHFGQIAQLNGLQSQNPIEGCKKERVPISIEMSQKTTQKGTLK